MTRRASSSSSSSFDQAPPSPSPRPHTAYAAPPLSSLLAAAALAQAQLSAAPTRESAGADPWPRVTVQLTPPAIIVATLLAVLAGFGALFLYRLATARACQCALCAGEYTMEGIIGSGGFGKVYAVTRKSDSARLVLKMIPCEDVNDATEALKEARELRFLVHPRVVRYYADFLHVARSAVATASRGDGDLHVCIVMERCRFDLRRYIQRSRRRGAAIPETTIVRWAAQLVSGLRYCHSKGVVHRDIASKNIFVTDADDLRLGDFGLARSVRRHDTELTEAGTDVYKSPEAIAGGRRDGRKADVFALGLVLLELVTQRFAWERKGGGSLGAAMLAKEAGALDAALAEVPAPYSPSLRLLIRRCLTGEAALRPSAEDLFRFKILRRGLGAPARGAGGGGADGRTGGGALHLSSDEDDEGVGGTARGGENGGLLVEGEAAEAAAVVASGQQQQQPPSVQRVGIAAGGRVDYATPIEAPVPGDSRVVRGAFEGGEHGAGAPAASGGVAAVYSRAARVGAGSRLTPRDLAAAAAAAVVAPAATAPPVPRLPLRDGAALDDAGRGLAREADPASSSTSRLDRDAQLRPPPSQAPEHPQPQRQQRPDAAAPDTGASPRRRPRFATDGGGVSRATAGSAAGSLFDRSPRLAGGSATAPSPAPHHAAAPPRFRDSTPHSPVVVIGTARGPVLASAMARQESEDDEDGRRSTAVSTSDSESDSPTAASSAAE